MSNSWKTEKTPPDSVIQSVSDVYERGQTMDAFIRATDFAPLEDWAGIHGCGLATRIAMNTGGFRLALRIAARMWHSDKNHPLSQFEYGIQIMNRRGPLAFWLDSRTWPAMAGGTAEWQAEFLALKSWVLSDLRDFCAANELIKLAESIAPQAPWVHLQRAHYLERLEKVEAALEVASAACQLHPHPFYRPGVQVMANLLQLLDRDEEAIQLLQQADASLQNGQVAVQLYSLLVNTQQWPAAGQALERYAALSPLLEPAAKLWLQGQRAQTAYQLGNRSAAIHFASALNDPFHQQFSENLARPLPTVERVRLDVPFVRQYFKTCAPATLASLGRHWKMPAEHVALVETICYDGTPAWQQRDWAELNGWLVREFRVTWESVLALLAEGIPFAITTVEAASAHMQAVMGFDQTRGTLLLRDPSQPYCLESHAREFFERYRAFGPRGAVFLPRSESSRLSGISLPDVEVYDEYHGFTLALSRYDREKARAALGLLESKWPDHPVSWEARLDLAGYDSNNEEQIRCLDRLLELFPGNPARLLRRVSCLRDATREERIEFLEMTCANKNADPALYVELARNLMADAPRQASAEWWLRRAFRWRPVDSGVMTALADLRWLRGQFAEATELYRFAAMVEGYREPLYQSWFAACRQVRQMDAALAQLEDRFQRFGGRSAQPALTLAWALREIEQPEKARAILTQAIQLRPDDGHLLLRAAGLNARLGAGEPADTLLKKAQGKVRENDWLRAAAEIAEVRFDAKGHLQFSREILALEPLAVDAHAGVARSLAQLEGRPVAVAHLKDACARHPHHCGLQRLCIEWLRGEGFEAVVAPAGDFLKISPRDAWTRRELAWALANLNRQDEALAQAEAARRIEPRNSASWGLLGHIQERFRYFSEAREHFRRAIELSVDNSNAIAGLLRLSNTDRERKAELAFVERELVRQVVRGDGLLAFMEAARPLLEPEALLKILQQAHGDRPDLWHAWSALVMQLDHLGRSGEALPLARQAAGRFPHIPRLWLDLAAVHRRLGEAEAEIESAQRSFEINPGWSHSAFALADALERHRDLNEAQLVYERALRHNPSEPQLHVQMATVLWRIRQPMAALDSIEKALRLESNFDQAWNLLINWSRECGHAQRPVNFVRELTRDRPGDIYGWLMLAKVLSGAAELLQRLNAVERALELNPHCFEAWDLKAELLAGALQFTAAVEACEKGMASVATNSFMLRGRRAWIEAQRNQMPEAIREMRAVLAENAGYTWGWHQLVVWLTGQEAYADAEGAIEQLLKMQPQDAWSQRQLALVRLKQGDKAGAQKVFSIVLDASPTDKFAAENLFNLQLEIGNLTGAAETLRRMQTHQPGARTLAREVILLARTGDNAMALKHFDTLCTQPDPDHWPVQAAAGALQKAGLSGKALKKLKRALRTKDCNPQVGATAIQFLIEKRQSLGAVRLFGRIFSSETRTRAAEILAEGLAKLNARWSLRIVIWRYREVFFKDDAAWGKVGYALAKFKRMRAVAEWLGDWRSRPSVEPWMLFNLCYALRHLGCYLPANEVAEYAVQKWGYRQENAGDFRLFLAVEKALAGSTDAAIENLQRVHVRSTVPYDQQLLAITKALVEFQQSPAETRRRHFKAIRKQLSASFPAGKTLKSGRDVRQTLRRAGKVFVQNGAGQAAKFWFFWKLNWQWLLIPLTPILLLLGLFPPLLIGLVL